MAKLFQPEVTEANGTIRVAWDNCQAPRDNGHLVWVLILAPILAIGGLIPACLILGGKLDLPWFSYPFAICWGTLWWLCALGAGYDLVRRRWAEWIEVSKDTITVGRQGFLAPKPTTIQIRPDVEWFVGRVIDIDGAANRPSLLVTRTNSWGGKSRTEIGSWLTRTAREQIFRIIADFIVAQNIPVKVTHLTT
jgi:hypothetical protein